MVKVLPPKSNERRPVVPFQGPNDVISFPFPTFKFANEKNWNQVAPPAEEGHTYKFNKYLEAEGIWSFWSEAEAIDVVFSVKAFLWHWWW